VLVLPVVCLALGFLLRLALIWAVPTNYSFDAYQRWAGREHLLIQDWLPATQSLLVLNEGLGGGLWSARALLALVASVGMAMAAVVARRLGGVTAGWCFVPLSLFGPALCWTVVPYQEGTYLALWMSGLALALASRDDASRKGVRLAADLCIGATALCRTEGWPLVALYVLWWRDRESLRALWGVGFWLAWKWGVGLEPLRPSPVSYADWEGLGARFELGAYGHSLAKHGGHWIRTGGWALWLGGSAGAFLLLRKNDSSSDPVRRWGASLLAWVLCAQLASTLAWLAGLETATVRMTLLPGVMLAIFAAVGLASLLPRLPRHSRRLGVLSLLSLGVYFAADGWTAAHKSSRSVRWERVVVLRMAECEDCYFRVRPRKGLGTRDRHDGCEILQGISELRHPEDFYCASWPGAPARSPTHAVRWTRQGYDQRELKTR
jgi:hypothetical protein